MSGRFEPVRCLPGLRGAAVGRRERGTTFIIVLGILSVLALIASTLSYSTRLDVLANGSFGNAVQKQISGFTGVPRSALALSGQLQTATTQQWHQIGKPQEFSAPPPQNSGRKPSIFSIEAQAAANVQSMQSGSAISGAPNHAQGNAANAGGSANGIASWKIPLPRDADRAAGLLRDEKLPGELFHIEDECAKFNINTLGSWDEFEQKSAKQAGRAIPHIRLTDAIDAALQAEGIVDSGYAAELARAIVAWKYGADGQPGRAGFDDDGDGPDGARNLLENRRDDDHDGVVDNPEEAQCALRRDDPASGTRESGDLAGLRAKRLGSDAYILEANGIDDNSNGDVDEQNESVDEPDEFIDDPRQIPNGDDNPFDTLNELLQVKLVTPAVFEALSKHFTVFSASAQRFETGSTAQAGAENSIPLALNGVTAEELIAALEKSFPDTDSQLIRQFAANLIDYRDADRIPTEIADTQDALHPILGLEPDVVLNEVYSDAVTEELDGDDGQFIEIFNPWDEAMTVDGYQLNTGAGVYTLSGTVPPGGFLIVTDDIDGTNDPEREEKTNTGSFYDIFHQLGSGSNKQLVEFVNFDLTNTLGEIRLNDANGRLVDYISYNNGQFDGFSQSLQRGDPRVRFQAKMTPTPFERNTNELEPDKWNGRDALALDPLREKPFVSPVDVLRVFAGYVDLSGLPHEWNQPVIQPAGKDRIDSRIVDLFTIERRGQTPAASAEGELDGVEEGAETPSGNEIISQKTMRRRDTAGVERSAQRDNPNDAVEESATAAWAAKFRLQLARAHAENPVQYGKININTCSRAQLLALPEMTEELAGRILEYRELCEQENARGGISGANVQLGAIIPFERLSDLLRQEAIWNGYAGPEGEAERIRLSAAWLPCLTVNSKAFTVDFGPRLSALEKQQDQLPVKYHALLALDGKGTRIVNWHRNR